MRDVAAYTAPANADNRWCCPAYYNLSQHEDGRLFLSVRADGAQYASVMAVPREQLLRLADTIYEKLGKPVPAA